MLRGDEVKDDTGCQAVFAEQGASASQLTAAKVLDTEYRPLKMAGEATDAVSAFTQVKMKDAPRLLQLLETKCAKIWIRLPPNRRPGEWDMVDHSVVLLQIKLRDDSWAGLLRERKPEE